MHLLNQLPTDLNFIVNALIIYQLKQLTTIINIAAAAMIFLHMLY